MKKIIIFFLVITVGFSATLIIYNNSGLYSSARNVKGEFKVPVIPSFVKNSFYFTPMLDMKFNEQSNLTLNSILSQNKFIILNKQKYEVVSISPLILKKDNKYFYNLDIKGFEFSKLPNSTGVSFSGFTKTATVLNYSYLFSGVSFKINYFFDSGRIYGELSIINSTNHDFSKDKIYIVSQDMNISKSYEQTKSLLRSYSVSASPQKAGERYIYEIKKINLSENSNITTPFISENVNYSKYYKFFPTSHLSNLKSVISFKTNSRLPAGNWRVIEKSSKTSVFSPQITLSNISKNENVELQYDEAYDVKGIETQLKSSHESKISRITFKDAIYNYKDTPINVKIYKYAKNAKLINYKGKFTKIGDYVIIELKVKPNFRSDVEYTLEYHY